MGYLCSELPPTTLNWEYQPGISLGYQTEMVLSEMFWSNNLFASSKSPSLNLKSTCAKGGAASWDSYIGICHHWSFHFASRAESSFFAFFLVGFFSTFVLVFTSYSFVNCVRSVPLRLLKSSSASCEANLQIILVFIVRNLLLYYTSKGVAPLRLFTEKLAKSPTFSVFIAAI